MRTITLDPAPPKLLPRPRPPHDAHPRKLAQFEYGLLKGRRQRPCARSRLTWRLRSCSHDLARPTMHTLASLPSINNVEDLLFCKSHTNPAFTSKSSPLATFLSRHSTNGLDSPLHEKPAIADVMSWATAVGACICIPHSFCSEACEHRKEKISLCTQLRKKTH